MNDQHFKMLKTLQACKAPTGEKKGKKKQPKIVLRTCAAAYPAAVVFLRFY